MSERAPRAGALSASKRALLERMLEGRAAQAQAGPTIPRRPSGPSAPLSFAQQRLWFIHQIDPRSPAYHVPIALRLRGRPDEDVLRRALDEVVRRHESLRTRFTTQDGEARQWVDPPARVPLPLVDLSARPGAERESELARLVREEAAAPFDLSRGPLLRAGLVRVASDDHAFLLTMHHIVSDGWSMGVLVREIAALYEAFAADRPSPLPEPEVQYADFAVWQREALEGERGEREMAWWRERLTPLPPPLELPADRPRPQAPSFRGGVERLSVPAELAGALRALAREEDATLFMVLLAAFTGWLSRLTGETDVAVGTGIANRTLPEVEPLIGFFVNALVLRTRCDGDPSFRALLGRVKETVLGAFAHQDLPFERIVEDLHPQRDLARNPIFQVAFALQNAPLGELTLPGLSIGSAPSETGATRFDLELHLWEREGGGIDGFLFYSADLFDAATVRRIASRYGAILASLAEDPDRPLSRLRVAAGDERAQAIRLAKGAALPVPSASVLARFDAQAARSPQSLAVRDEERDVSYGDLAAASRRLAASLRALGARRGARVAILMERSAASVAAALAVVRTGAAYVPLDPANPDARLLAMLERSGATLALVAPSLAGRLNGARARLVPLDGHALFAIGEEDAGAAQRGGDGEGDDGGPVAVTGDDLAYVVFTSGSTGEPSGVEVTHGGLANLVAWHLAVFGVTEADRATLLAGPGFDASVWELWPALAAGASLLVPGERVRLDPPALRDWLVEERVSVAFLPTPLAERVLALDWPERCALRILLTGGDRLHAVGGRARPFRVVNNYGPTEAAVVATSGDVDGGGSRRAPTIGRPIANVAAYVLGPDLEPAPAGVAGELYVGGAGIARGYAGRPELTAQRFLPDPYADRPGARLYRTGDRARQLADGRIEFLGRADTQIKVRGVRAEPGEIESALASHPRVAAVAVAAVRSGACGADAREADGETRLCAYVVPRATVADDGEGEAEHVARWRELYDATYVGSGDSDGDGDFNISGWNSSYTGAPIDPEEMREWRSETVARILALRPRKVLEVGCGTGLLLSRIAPFCTRYVATDFSAASLDLVARLCAGRKDLAHVERLQRQADEDEGLEPGGFDVVILNSVVQYFPDRAYLERVLEGALRLVATGGALFVGDVRDLRLQKAFAASVAVEGIRASAGDTRDGPGDDDARMRARAERLVADEEELLVHPALFATLCAREARGATALPLVKRGRADNELTRFRYDVVLRVGRRDDGVRGPAETVRLAFDERTPRSGRSHGVEDVPGLEEAFRSQAEVLVLSGVPNARLAGSMEAAQRLGLVAGDAWDGATRDRERPTQVHPDDAAALGVPFGYGGTPVLSDVSEDAFDVVFVREKSAGPRAAARVTGRAAGDGDSPVPSFATGEGSAPEPARASALDAAAGAVSALFVQRSAPGSGRADLTNLPLRASQRGALSTALREHAASLLPEAMVPSLFVFLDALPTTPSGKVDRARLPAPVDAGPVASFVEPRTPTERAIARVWSEVLGLPRVGASDDFFAIGGHSLLATQVLSRLRGALDVEIPLRAIFEAPVLAALAADVEARIVGALADARAPGPAGSAGRALRAGAVRDPEDVSQDPEGVAREVPAGEEESLARPPGPIPVADRTAPLPLSFAQQRLWFIDALEPGGAAYNIPNAIRFRGALDADALRRALAEIVRRHEPLRTRFVAGPDGPRQVIGPPVLPALDVEVLGDAIDPQGRARELLEAEFVRPFDLARGPLLRARLLRLGPDDHVLSLVVHHIAADGWSVGVLVREMGALYTAYARGETSPLADLPVQYADWAQWQREDLERGGLKRQLDWWRCELSGIAPLELPADRPRPAHPSQRGEAIEWTLDAGLARAVAVVAKESGATLHMALLAAFGAVLGRWSGQDALAIGTPVAGRTRVEIEPLVGFFVNTLAVRLRLEGRGLTFRELVRRVRDAALAAYAHQDVPFERIVEEIQPERDTSRNPVFQAMLGLHNVPLGELTLPGLDVSGFAIEPATVQFDLEMSLFEARDGSLTGRLHFARDLFERPRMERLLDHFRRFLEEVAADPDAAVRRVPLLPVAERARLAALQTNVRRYEPTASLADVFAEAAAAHPEATALAGAAVGGPVTYAELAGRVHRLARLIASRGARRGARIALVLPRGPDLVTSVLAVLETGAAYVPVDPSYPEARIALMLEDAVPSLIVTNAALRGRLTGGGAEILDLDRERETLAALSPERLSRKPSSPEDVAYLVYTSGTTGRPKGIAMRQGVVTNLVAWQAESSGGPRAGRRTAQFASLSFDVSVQEIFATLAEAGVLVLLTEEERRDPRALLDAIAREGIERLFLPFVALAGLAEAALEGPPRALRLREVVTAGERLRVTGEIRRFFASLPGATLDNHYGPSEAHVVTAERLSGDPFAWPELPAIGRPVPNARVLVLDGEMQPSPMGVAGEIHVGGDVLARGYHAREDLTADRFVPDPDGTGSRLYRTGDRGSVGEDGRIAFLGRMDRQVKVRGYRIEPAEIEAAIARLPGVRAVAVDARATGGAPPRLVAWIVPEGEGAGGSMAVRDALARTLPEYLVPSAYVTLAALPLDPNGKVDRGALPDPAPEPSGAVAELSPIERLVAGIFEDVLGVRGVGRDVSFFELGGHSLLATRAVARIRRVAGVEIPLRTVFERPTVRGLAEEVAAALREGDRPVAIPRAPRGASLPVSYQQERLWFLDQFDASPATAAGSPGGSAFTMLGALRLRGALDAGALAGALGALARRHESLRTRFPSEDGRPVQVVDPPGAVSLEVEDLAPGPASGAADSTAPGAADGAAPGAADHAANDDDEALEAVLRSRLEAEARRGFDLARGPLWRARLLRLGDAHHVLVVGMHHIVTDGWSMGVLVREVGTLYETFAAAGDGGSSAPTASPEERRHRRQAPDGDAGGDVDDRRPDACVLTDLPIQYGDYAAWQRRWLEEGELARQLAWWRGRLEGIEPLDLPADRSRPPVQSHAGARVRARIGPELGARLRALAREEGATLHMVLLAAFALVLGRWSGRDDVAVGTPVAGRTREETEGLIGFFINTLVLRVALGDAAGAGFAGDDFRSLLARVRETALGAYAHQDVPFESLLETLRPARDLSRSPVFQVWFNLVNVPGEEPRFGPLAVTPMGAEGVEAKFDVSLYASESGESGESGDAIDLDAVYATDLFDAWRIEELLAQLERVLVQAAADPGAALRAVSLVTDRARSELPDVSAPLSAEWRGAVHELFAARAAADPGALAVADPAGPWTYGELDARANRLARALAMRGVRPGDPVGVHAHRSAPTVCAMLGILKAGGVIVMLDPAHPAARLRLCLEEARPRAVVEVASAGPLPVELSELLARDLGAARLVLTDRRPAGPSRSGGDVTTDPLAGLSAEALEVHVGPDDAACITFTSGSTGRPKGVVGRHGSLTHFQPYLEARFGIGASDRFSMLSGLAHDPLQRDVFTPLVAGASVIVPDPDELDPARLAGWSRSARISVMTLTPAMAKILTAGDAPAPLRDLRTVFLVGEMLGRGDVERLRALAPRATLVNLYGTTETQRAVGHFVMPPGGPLLGEDGSPITRGTIPAGAGMPGAQLLVRGEAGEPAGLCEQGEIWVRSPHLALGYLDPVLTSERFSGNGAARAYRTGDLGRYDRRGVVVVEGRADAQVNIRGFRIELGEVEAALAAAPGVSGAVAALDAGARLVGYVTAAAGARVEPRAVREELRLRLPEAMIPSAVVVLEAFPLTPNGKIDRRALPAAAFGDPDAYAPPRSSDEEIACALFAEVLGVPRVGIDDSFFDLGGHSLLATRLVARARARLGVEVSLRALFEAPTPEGVARAIAAARGREGTAPPPVVRASEDERAKLSYAQRRMWFLERLEPGTAIFNVASALRLEGDLDTDALGRALAALEARHESLRTRFAADAGRPRQIVDPPRPDPLTILDLSAFPDPAAEAERRLAADASAPLDLEHGPIWRATLWRLGPSAHVVSLVVHHLVTDGWSMDLLVREMGALYGAFVEGREAALPALPIQYADWAAWQRAWLEGGESDRQLAWWRQELAGARPVDLPLDRPRPARRAQRGAEIGFEVPARTADALARIAHAEGATLFHALLACFQALLARHAAASDIVVGTPVANRAQPEAAAIVGLFVNVLAIRTRIDADASLREILKRVRETTLDAQARQDVPFEAVVEALHVERDLARNPLFDAMFVLQHVPDGASAESAAAIAAATGLRVELLAADTGMSEFDVTLLMAESAGRIVGSLVYDADLFDRASAQSLIAHFSALADAFGSAPDALLGEVDLSSPDERERIARSNRTAAARPAQTLTELFEARVALGGGDLAVMDEEGVLTFAELDARAAGVARRLRAAGVGPETGVALLAGRTSGSIAGMLGILKAGGILVPLDASLPEDRLARMVATADVRAVVAERGFERVIRRAPTGPLLVIPLGGDEDGSDERDGGVSTAVVRTPTDAAGRGTALAGVVSPSNAAYVLFTSGSTGEPKGSVLEHRAVADRILCRVAQTRLGPGDRVLHFTSPVFDTSLEELLAPLVSGAAIVIHPDPRGEMPADWIARIARTGVTVAHLSVGFVNELADHVVRSGGALPPSLRLIVAGAETPSGARLADLLRAGGRDLVVENTYGPTEAVIEATAYEMRVPEACGDPVPIGAPLENTAVHLLDANLRPVPFGAFGEVFIGGVSLARGYAGRPAETAAVFVPDPVSANPGARLYRTGDLARYRADGALVFAGRRDGQVKIRGFRVELGEIEASLLRAPGVREAAALVRGAGARATLAAFIVPSDPRAFDAEVVREAVRARLPEYMVPQSIVTLDAMPRTAGDKIDRRALLALPIAERRRERTAARDELEERVAALWRETLGAEGDTDVHENFFEAGGNSLLAVRLAVAVRGALGRELPVAEVFRRPTIAELARALRADADAAQAAASDGGSADLVTLRAGDGLAPLVCVHEIGGGVAAFSPLTAHVDPRRPVLAIHALGAATDGEIEQTAARHARTLARAVPEGPVHLLGWSYGAWLAYEIAGHLRDAGRDVGALVLLDAAAPEDAAREAPKALLRGRPIPSGSASREASPGARLARAMAALWGIVVDVDDPQGAIDAARASGALPDGLPDAEARAWLLGVADRLEAADCYRPRPYPGDVVLVRGTESTVSREDDEALGWRRLVRGRLDVAWAPGSHYSIVDGEGARAVAAIVELHAARDRKGAGRPGAGGETSVASSRTPEASHPERAGAGGTPRPREGAEDTRS